MRYIVLYSAVVRGGSRTLPLGGHKLPKLARGENFGACPWVWLYLGAVFRVYGEKVYGQTNYIFFLPEN